MANEAKILSLVGSKEFSRSESSGEMQRKIQELHCIEQKDQLELQVECCGIFPTLYSALYISLGNSYCKCEFCEKWDFENVNFVQKWDFEIVNLMKSEIFKMWILG